MRFLAQIVSWVFLPMLMPIYGLLIAMYFPSESESALQVQANLYVMPDAFKWHILLLFFLLSVMAPGFSLLMLKRQNRIETLELDNREERAFPITVTIIYCAMLGIFLYMQIPHNAIPTIIFALPWAGMLAASVAGIITKFEKISLHAMGAGMLFGFLVMYYQTQELFNFNTLICAALIGGLVMTSRMYLGKHTLRQSISGYLLGVFAMVIVLGLFPNLSLLME